MNNSVVIKGNKYGMVVVLDSEIEFSQLKKDLIEKFQSASKFFDKASMAISFEGRNLTQQEEKALLDAISEHSDINIVCVIDNNEIREQHFKKAVTAKVDAISAQNGHFYKGTLRSGQQLDSECSLIILGDVNSGAIVNARGNVVILGALKGNVNAGVDGNEDAFVVALEMAPIQIRIGDTIARSNDTSGVIKPLSPGPMIAFVEDQNIYIEKLDKEILNDIRLS